MNNSCHLYAIKMYIVKKKMNTSKFPHELSLLLQEYHSSIPEKNIEEAREKKWEKNEKSE